MMIASTNPPFSARLMKRENVDSNASLLLNRTNYQVSNNETNIASAKTQIAGSDENIFISPPRRLRSRSLPALRAARRRCPLHMAATAAIAQQFWPASFVGQYKLDPRIVAPARTARRSRCRWRQCDAVVRRARARQFQVQRRGLRRPYCWFVTLRYLQPWMIISQLY